MHCFCLPTQLQHQVCTGWPHTCQHIFCMQTPGLLRLLLTQRSNKDNARSSAFSPILSSLLAPQPQKCLFFRHYFVTQYFTWEEREKEEIVIILLLPLQYGKHVQGERMSNNSSTAAAAACAAHPLFSLHSHSLLIWLPKKSHLNNCVQKKEADLHCATLDVIWFHQPERFPALHGHLREEPTVSPSHTCKWCAPANPHLSFLE